MQYKIYEVNTQLSLSRCLTKTQSDSVNPAKLSYGKHQIKLSVELMDY